MNERLAQALQDVGLFELERRARAGAFEGELGSLALVRELDLESQKATGLAGMLIFKLREKFIHGDYNGQPKN